MKASSSVSLASRFLYWVVCLCGLSDRSMIYMVNGQLIEFFNNPSTESDISSTASDSNPSTFNPNGKVIAVPVTFNSSAIINKMTLYGGYAPTGLPAEDSFRVIVHEDFSGLPGTVIYDSLMDGGLTQSRVNSTVTPFGNSRREFDHTIILNQPLLLGEAATYWFEIFHDPAVLSPDTSRWAWYWKDAVGKNAAGALEAPGMTWQTRFEEEFCWKLEGTPAPVPTMAPTPVPTMAPTPVPTLAPTTVPSQAPSKNPTKITKCLLEGHDLETCHEHFPSFRRNLRKVNARSLIESNKECPGEEYDMYLVAHGAHFAGLATPQDASKNCPSLVFHAESYESGLEKVALQAHRDDVIKLEDQHKLHLGNKPLAQIVRSFDIAPVTKNGLLYDAISNNCVVMLRNMADSLDIPVDSRMLKFITNKLTGSASEHIIEMMKESPTFSLLYEGNRRLLKGLSTEDLIAKVIQLYV